MQRSIPPPQSIIHRREHFIWIPKMPGRADRQVPGARSGTGLNARPAVASPAPDLASPRLGAVGVSGVLVRS